MYCVSAGDGYHGNTLAHECQMWLVLCAEDPLVGNIAQLYMTNREEHDKTAAEWTRRFAQG